MRATVQNHLQCFRVIGGCAQVLTVTMALEKFYFVALNPNTLAKTVVLTSLYFSGHVEVKEVNKKNSLKVVVQEI